MDGKTAAVVLLAVAVTLGSLRALAGGSGHEGGPPLGAQPVVLEVPVGASDAERLELLRADFERRRHRIDWKSDSVVKRIRWALRDAQRALHDANPDAARRRLDDAQALLESW